MREGDAVMLTIRDASRATGLSVKAIRRRVERGTLPHELVDGVRRVPMSALLCAGLLVTRPDARRADGSAAGDPLSALARRVEQLEARVTELEGAEPDRRPAARDLYSALS